MKFAWINRHIVNAQDRNLPLSDRGFLLGDGIFDTLKYLPEFGILWFDEHFKRLTEHAQHLRITVPFTPKEIQDAINTLIERNNNHDKVLIFRLTLTRGSGVRGIMPPLGIEQKPQLVITCSEFNSDINLPPAKLTIAKTIKRNEGSILSQIKSLNYGDAVLAKLEAHEKDADDCILLNNVGHITCTSVANIIIQTAEDDLYTPCRTDGVMNGVIRQRLIDHYNVQEESLTQEQLLEAKHVYLTNSVMHIRPVISIDDKKYTTGQTLTLSNDSDVFSNQDYRT